MSHHEHDLTGTLLTWPAVEGRIFHLYELDPTHVAAQPSGNMGNTMRRTTQETGSTPEFCLLAEHAHPVVLLELDPTHLFGHEAIAS